MSVKFNADGFTVEVKTHESPIESWLETQDELVELLQSENDEVRANHFRYLQLLRNMMPDLETAKKMME